MAKYLLILKVILTTQRTTHEESLECHVWCDPDELGNKISEKKEKFETLFKSKALKEGVSDLGVSLSLTQVVPL